MSAPKTSNRADLTNGEINAVIDEVIRTLEAARPGGPRRRSTAQVIDTCVGRLLAVRRTYLKRAEPKSGRDVEAALFGGKDKTPWTISKSADPMEGRA